MGFLPWHHFSIGILGLSFWRWLIGGVCLLVSMPRIKVGVYEDDIGLSLSIDLIMRFLQE